MNTVREERWSMKNLGGWTLAMGVSAMLFVAPSAWAKECARVCVDDLARNSKLCKQHAKNKSVECVQMMTQAKDECLKECKNPSQKAAPQEDDSHEDDSHEDAH
ncbi:hypothetical protein G4177_04775 [Corallococcus sp. ZKHCc1 1396]|uniref:Cys-rich protein n=1 Tax=Corallococcus soli TaxID=2710757 RepID=A0ABR9PHW3_9BACT|nr:hypothetical protein [Corallococcus soli]MBE4747494.1 hypothetical protein [Corallococcus soli]